MALKPVLTTTEGLDEALKPLYTETEGTFTLSLDRETLDKHPHVAGLVSANKANAEKAKERLARIEALEVKLGAIPDDFDPVKWDKLKDGKPDEAALIKMREKFEVEVNEWKGKAEAAEGLARSNAIERDLTDALSAAGVTNPAFQQAARKMLSDKVKIGDNGSPFISDDMGPQGLSDHVKRWAAGDGKDFVTAPKGGDSKGGSDVGKLNNMNRSKMNNQQKADYIAANGQEAFLKLPR